ncbi:MAG: hypothetical protein JW909_08480 [Planctomycetes bacterium]|nr:hypothetical protein [Planctomycetota bacterium]
MKQTRMLLWAAALAAGCAGGWLYYDITVDWVNPLPVTVTAGMDYPVTVAVAGGTSVDHVNIHWSAVGDPRYAAQEETVAQAGVPGQFNFVINFDDTVTTTYYVAVHAKVNGGNYYSAVTPVTVVPGPPYVTWTTLPPDPMAADTDHAVEYTVTGGTAVDSVRVQWTPYINNPSSTPQSWSTGYTGTVPGTFSDTVNLSPTSDKVYRMCVRAQVDGDIRYSPVISRLVELAAPVDPYEDNDSFGEAAFLGGTGYSGTVAGYLYPGGDSDYYWVSAGAGLLYVDLTSLPADYDLFIYDSTFVIQDYSTQYGTTDESIVLDVTSGTYYILVRGYMEAYDEAAYSLTVTVP